MQDIERLNRLALYAGPGSMKSDSPLVLVNALVTAGLVGDCIDGQSQDYIPGGQFTDLVTFLGCSPNIALSPAEGAHHCFVRIPAPLSKPRLHAGANTCAPKCSRCSLVREDWGNCEHGDFCTQCTVEERQQNLAWRRRGLLSCWVISLVNIYPHEAVPSSQLLTLLGDVSGVEWGYAYLQAINK